MDWLLSNCQETLFRYPVFSFLGASGVLLTLLALTQYNFYWTKRSNFPIVGSPTDADFRLAIKEGVAKYPDRPFMLPNDPPTIIAPKSTINQFKQFNDDEASFSAVVEELFHPRVTGFGVEDPVVSSVVQRDISGQIASFSSSLQDEATHSFIKTIGSGEDWTSVTLYSTLAKIVALVSGRIFVGRPLSRDEEWVDISINYTIGISQARLKLSRWPRWAVNVVGPFLKEVKSLHKLRERAMELVKPILNAQLCKNGNEKLYSDEGDEEGNGISWFLARMHSDKSREPKLLTNQLLGLSFAAIHTTTNTVTQAIFDLATHREYIPLLRDEIKHVMSEDGYDIENDGVLRLRKTSILKLGKLDSFIKESQRINPLSLVSHLRKVTQDIHLSTGHVIPKGMNIAIPAYEIHNESATLYSTGHTKPLNEFDGLRYYNLRRLPGNENRHHFVTTSSDSLAFGHGKHSCPGRFFAGTEIKVIMIELLRNWDFRFPGDNKMEGGIWRRPKNTFRALDCLPCIDACIEVRKRKS